MPSDYASADVSEMANKPESKLQADVDRNDLASKLLKQALDDRAQRHGQRRILFWLVMGVVPVAILATGGMMAVLMYRGDVGDPVYIAFISAMAVQSFALIATLARSLYRDETPPERETTAPPQ